MIFDSMMFVALQFSFPYYKKKKKKKPGENSYFKASIPA